VTIPGGFGTLDETLEITTWQQLGFHSKPVGVLNVGGFFDHLLAFLDHATQEVGACGQPGYAWLWLWPADDEAWLTRGGPSEGRGGGTVGLWDCCGPL
jgi:hypothetical protein